MTTEPLSAALQYAAAGIAVLPTHWPTAAGRCSCGCDHPQCWQRAKHPLVPRTLFTTDSQQIRRWWEQWPQANVGIAAEGTVILDLDPGPHEPDPLPAFAERWGISLEDTVTCRTGSGGWHLYFHPPQETKVGWTGKDRLGVGCDVLTGPNSYVVAPPSIHHSLGRYVWVEGRSITERPLTSSPPLVGQELARRLPAAWAIRVAPYWVVGHLGLSVQARQRLRRLLGVQRAIK